MGIMSSLFSIIHLWPSWSGILGTNTILQNEKYKVTLLKQVYNNSLSQEEIYLDGMKNIT